jgi:hypothetical protein
VAPDISYGGRLDRVYHLPNRKRLIVTDIKVGSGKELRYWLQCAAYTLAFADGNVEDGNVEDGNVDSYDFALLNLGKNGHP